MFYLFKIEFLLIKCYNYIMKKEEFNLYYTKYNSFNTMVDRLKFCMEVLKPTTCNKIGTFLNIPVPTISRIKNGETKNSNEGYLRAIAGYFDVTYEWLVISKYYPIFKEDLDIECINNCNLGAEIKDILKIDGNDLLSRIKTKEDYQQICNALPFYKELFSKFIIFLNESNYLKNAEDKNIEKILSCMTTTEQEQMSITLKQENLRKLVVENFHASKKFTRDEEDQSNNKKNIDKHLKKRVKIN